ncbi:MAG: NUDIX hydrolase [Fusobacteriaceae bacterium]
MYESKFIKKSFDMSEKIIGRDKYLNFAVIILITKVENVEYLILQKRAKNISQGGEVCFPGGKVEGTDSSSMETALRECEEEIGVNREKIKILGKLGTHLTSASGVIIDVYIGNIELKSFDDLKINYSEVERCFFIPIEFFLREEPRIEKLQSETLPFYEEKGKKYILPVKELKLPKRYHSPWKSKPREVYFYFYEGDVIWGITGEIIYEFTKYLK